MSDDLFSYFSSKGTRKVDPIDDDDFNSFGATPQPPADDLAHNPLLPSVCEDDLEQQAFRQAQGQPPVEASVDTEAEAESQLMEEPLAPVADEPAPPKKEQGHWDFLASLLGIKRSTEEKKPAAPAPPAAPVQKASAKTPSTDARREIGDSKTSASKEVDLFTLKSGQGDDENPVLSTLFQPASDSGFVRENELSGEATADDDELDYLEFEVEELDPTVREDAHQPRRSRREQRASNERSSGERTTGERGSGERGSGERGSGERGSGDSDSRGQHRRPRGQRSAERTAGYRAESLKVPDDSDDEQPLVRQERAPAGEERGPRRRRRRRSRRDETHSEVAPVESEAIRPSSQSSWGSDDQRDPPDDFFDEIGWQPSGAGKSADFDDAEVEDVSETTRDRDEETPAGDRPRRRRRRRGARPSNEGTEPGTHERRPATIVRNESFGDDDDDFDDDLDVARGSSSMYERDRSGASGGTRKPKSGEDRERKHSFPTWDEAISGLVESNIKNHSKYSSQSGRPRGRGRRR